jgi:hypothetical protein
MLGSVRECIERKLRERLGDIGFGSMLRDVREETKQNGGTPYATNDDLAELHHLGRVAEHVRTGGQPRGLGSLCNVCQHGVRDPLAHGRAATAADLPRLLELVDFAQSM